MKGRTIIAAMALAAFVAGCGSAAEQQQFEHPGLDQRGSSTKCATSIGIEAPFTGPVAMLGHEQLHFAQLAIQTDNTANGTNITLAQGDTQLMPPRRRPSPSSSSRTPRSSRSSGPPAARRSRRSDR